MPALPDGDVAPDDGAPAGLGRSTAPTARAVRRLPARAVLHGALRVLRLQHLHGDRAGRRREPGRLRDDRAARDRARRPGHARAGLPRRPVSTVFVGGGTPTVLPADGPRAHARRRPATPGASPPDAEVTTEANPDSVTPGVAAPRWPTPGSRASRSACSPRCRTCWRRSSARTTRGASRTSCAWARDAGLAVSLDLIYGTPGESLDDWRTSVEAALATGVDHVSAYALVVEAGHEDGRAGAPRARSRCPTRTTRPRSTSWPTTCSPTAGPALVRGEQLGAHAGPRVPAQPRATGAGDDWWGVGPGAHSHVGGVRWWNVKHPRAYADAARGRAEPRRRAGRPLDAGDGAARAGHARRPARRGAAAGRRCSARARRDGRRAWSRTGCSTGARRSARTARAARVLTRRGRLLADAVVRTLTD